MKVSNIVSASIPLLLSSTTVKAITFPVYTDSNPYPGDTEDAKDPEQQPYANPPETYALSAADQQVVLDEHNRLRALHVDTDPLTWSDTLAQYAEEYAAAYNCSSGVLHHSGGPYGENLAIGYSLSNAVDAWYAEIKYYNYSNPGFASNDGHFTQVVWKDTKQVGCAIRYCNSVWQNYVVCEYDPSGNYLGEFADNVMPLKAFVAKPETTTSTTSTKKATTPKAEESTPVAKTTASVAPIENVKKSTKVTTTIKSSTHSGTNTISATTKVVVDAESASLKKTTSGTTTLVPSSKVLSHVSALYGNTTFQTTERVDAQGVTYVSGTATGVHGAGLDASGKVRPVATDASNAGTHGVAVTITAQQTEIVAVTDCPKCSLAEAAVKSANSVAAKAGVTPQLDDAVLRIKTTYTTAGNVVTSYTTYCPESGKTAPTTEAAVAAKAANNAGPIATTTATKAGKVETAAEQTTTTKAAGKETTTKIAGKETTAKIAGKETTTKIAGKETTTKIATTTANPAAPAAQQATTNVAKGQEAKTTASAQTPEAEQLASVKAYTQSTANGETQAGEITTSGTKTAQGIKSFEGLATGLNPNILLSTLAMIVMSFF